MIDIHNAKQVAWSEMGEATRAEIVRQESCGAVSEWLHYSGWKANDTSLFLRDEGVYRILIGTEVPPISTRPSDEMDLTQLCKPQGLWHKDTRDEMERWGHGWELYTRAGWTSVRTKCYFHISYAVLRAKPAPAPNRIERLVFIAYNGGTLFDNEYALVAAHALIKTMQGGDPKLLAAYNDAIK